MCYLPRNNPPERVKRATNEQARSPMPPGETGAGGCHSVRRSRRRSADSREREVHAMGIVAGRHHGPPPGEDQIIAPMPADDLAPHAWAMPRATAMAGMSTATERSCIASAAGSPSTPAAAMPISVPGIGWCCHRTPRTRPPSAPTASAAGRPQTPTCQTPAAACRRDGGAPLCNLPRDREHRRRA